jgi:hypothetical protein
MAAYYSDELLDRIVAALGPNNPRVKASDIRYRIVAIADHLSFDLHYEQMPNGKQKGLVLNSLSKQISDVLHAIDALDRFTVKEIEMQADNSEALDDYLQLPATAWSKIQLIKQNIELLGEWTSAAGKGQDKSDRVKGKKEPNWNAVEAIQRLWIDTHLAVTKPNGQTQTSEPSVRQLQSFAGLALKPVFDRYGIEPKLGNICADIITPPRNRGKR